MLSKRFRAFAEVVGVITIGLFAVYGLLAFLGIAPALGTALAAGQRSPQAAAPIVPATFNYQGFLRNADGSLLNGVYTITTRIYADVVSTTGLYTETFSDVNVRDGWFNVVLGDNPQGQDLQAVFSSMPRYIGLTLAGLGSELVPRQRFHGVPWALYATNASQANDFAVSGLLTATTITASGPASVAGLAVNGNTTVSGNTTVGGNTTINGNTGVSGYITAGKSLTVTGNISWDRATGHLTGLTLSGGYVATGDYGSVGTATMVPANNSICFLTYVWFQEIDTNNEDAKCIIDIDGNNWRLQAVTNSGFDQYAQCEARCLQW